ncbi:uncharacterized protein LOC134666517 isoform X1 [Cydia fagiglandana]|uniref:uncharacterized protein LOC134666517 isoform X1 n=1 Tax=Cydia fagiglandana TaxID=1458189 RepID=UPI002FEDF63F
MYGTSTASTTSGSRGASVAVDRRVRVVRLMRARRASPAFGFSLRGGREYATGFFVSKVEFNSEAHLQGLKVGDQLVSVNGYRVDDAVHCELVHYLASQSRLKIKVRHVGMVPIKDKAHESLSWQYVSDRASLGSDVSSSPTLCHDTERMADLRLSILVPPRAKLGCGICKGPEWKPGIFVQFVRENGIAREAGLRPGDQILACNGQDFANVSFNDAISAMKASGRLELLIREGAGTELVSPESSGYNSSASSAAGERSPAPVAHVPLAPPAALRRRLASVAEEAADRADRLNMNRLKRRTWDSLDFDWKNMDIHNFDAPSDIEPDYDCPSIPNNPHTYENKSNIRKNNINKKEIISSPSNRTIINLTEDGATIQCSYDNQSPRKSTFSANQSNRDNDKKTIVVEVHHTSAPACGKPHCNYPPPMKKDLSSDTTSISSCGTLSSAIAEEIQKRKLNKKNSNPENSLPLSLIKKASLPLPTDDKKKQHDALIDEFKKVHRKMFSGQDPGEAGKAENNDVDSLDRQQTLPLRKIEAQSEILTNGHQQAKRDVSNGHTQQIRETYNGHVQQKRDTANGHISEALNGHILQKREDLNGFQQKRQVANGQPHSDGHMQQKREADNPPPPPPMPAVNGQLNGERKKLDISKSFPKTLNTDLVNSLNQRNGSLARTPTPDYNNKTDFKTQFKLKSVKDDKAELDSLESYTLKNPANVQPKPPSNYFVKAPNGTATMKKHQRPVSVTIGEYAGGGNSRREPSKLEFLNGDKPDGPVPAADDEHISNRLQSELALTLSRSNLRKKTDALGYQIGPDILRVDNNEDSDWSIDKNFHARYGNNLLPLPPSITIPKVSKVKH